MSPAENKAVFLSYASQDAEAAIRICDALRAAGVEVWFDQSELGGGDAWDAKIRGQIGSCALFLPLISANTQARLEGYFRLEWKLAAQRTHTMADEKAFLLPILLDATRDAEAKVPPEFKTVQWTKLPGGETTPAFAARVKKLMSGDVGASLDEARGAPDGRRQAAPLPRRGPSKWWWVPAIFGVMMALLLVLKERRKESAPPVVPAATPVASEISRLRASLRPDEWTRADFDAFVPVTDRLIHANSENGEAWALRSIANSVLVIRNLDTGTKPLEAGRDAADRAVRLAPGSPLAELSLGLHFVAMISRGGDPLACRVPMDRALAGLPANEKLSRYAELCSYWLGYQFEGTEKSARAWLAATPGASFPAGILAQSALVRRRPEEALKWAAQASADPEIAGVRSFVTAFEACYYLRADLAAAQAALDHVPAGQRSVHRVLASRWLVAMAEKHFDQALQELNRSPDVMLRDRLYHGPKVLLAGLANDAAGRGDVARAQFGEAEKILRTELTADADNQELRAVLALSLACQGRSEEARRELAAVEPLLTGRDPTVYTGHLIAVIAQVHGVLGEMDRMVPWLRILFTKPSANPFTPASFLFDSRFSATLGAPEIRALLKEFAYLDQPDATAPAKADLAAAALAKVDDKSVAVLAFTNLSDDKGNEYFSDGISEELLNVLAKVPGLKVTARTSSFHFKGMNTALPEIARQLGVAYVVEGSVRKAGDKVRITAELVKAADGFQVWSDTFTRDLKDIFAVQDEIAGLVARNLQLKLGVMARATATVDPEAYRLCLQGRQALVRRTMEGFDQAEKLFLQARAIEPGWAPIYAALADVWRLRTFDSETNSFGAPEAAWDPGLKNAKAAAGEALRLDPNLPEAYVALAGTYEISGNLAEAERLIRRALELNPNQADAYLVFGRVHSALGRMDESLAALQRAAELNPLAPRILDNLAGELYLAGRYEESWKILERASALQPDSDQIQCYRARLLTKLGRREEALQQARQFVDKPGTEARDFRWVEAAGVFVAFGRRADAEALGAKMDPTGSEKIVFFGYIGRPEEAIPLLGQLSFGWVDDLLWAREFDPIRNDPRYRAYLKKVGLVEADARARAWRAAHPDPIPARP